MRTSYKIFFSVLLFLVCVVFLFDMSKSDFMILVVVSLDFPTLITLLCAIRIKSFLKVFILAIIAALIGEFVYLETSSVYTPILFYRIFSQILIGSVAFCIVNMCNHRKGIMKNIDTSEKRVESMADNDINLSEGAATGENDSQNYKEEKDKQEDTGNVTDYIVGFIYDLKAIFSIGQSFESRTILNKSYTAICLAFLIGVFPMLYEYYGALRVIVCIGLWFFYSEIKSRQDIGPHWTYAVFGFFVLYNPIIPIHLGDQLIWLILNIVTVYVLYRLRLKLEVNAGQ